MKTQFQSFLGILLLIGINIAVWAWLNRPLEPAASWHGTITGFSFSPMRRDDNPLQGLHPTLKEIDADLEFLSDKVTAVRTYAMNGGLERVPELAARYGLNVTAGAWISPDLEHNEAELHKLIEIGRKHRNVVRLLVGNEVLLRGDLPVDLLIGYIQRVRNQVGHRVSTAEPWAAWMEHPELVKAVDFIAIHALPYWDGVPIDIAVDRVFEMYDELHRKYPDKPIIFSEVGWPSDGPPIGKAVPSRMNQARFLRSFLNQARDRNIVYYIVEAFDQPWKINIEGAVGAYWGVYNVDREEKFPMIGAVVPNPSWEEWAMIAIILALIPVLYFILRRQRVSNRGKILFGTVANFAASGIAWTAATGATQYQTPLSATIWILLLLLQLFALLVLLVEAVEVSEILWRSKGARDFHPLPHQPGYKYPGVSVHVPVHNEPPDMVCRTLTALAQLDYPDFEVIVIDNNTPDPAVWQPVKEYCQQLGPNFRFFHVDNLPGYKAGALNFGLRNTGEDKNIVAVIDSDYMVTSDWLKCLTPYFDDPNAGFVQAPQDYRDSNDNLFKRLCYWEYAGFFHIGMVQRNDFNAIIQHGTMTLIRKSALIEAGQWAEWCITEDAELGLRLLQEGYNSVYVKESLGRGLIPDTLSAYKTQRFRWAYGSVQILKQHLRSLLPRSRRGLSPAQKYYYVAGWLPWLSDGLALLLVFASLLLTVRLVVVFPPTNLPIEVFVFPTIGIFCFKVMRSLWLYTAQLKCSIRETIGALTAGLALTHTVGKAVISGILTSGRPFIRTPKLEPGRPLLSALSMVREELVLLILLWSSAAWVWSIDYFHNTQGKLWISVLLVQSIPCIAAVYMAVLNVVSRKQYVPATTPDVRPIVDMRIEVPEYIKPDRLILRR